MAENRVSRADAITAGRDILAALADRGITVRLGDDGKLRGGPAELIDEADRALLAANREAVLVALGDVPMTDAAGAAEHQPVVHIDVPGRDPRLLDELAAVLTRHPGPDLVLLHVEIDGHEVVMQ